MRGGRRAEVCGKKKPAHLRRELVAIRLPPWVISQLKGNGEIGYLIENIRYLLSLSFNTSQPQEFVCVLHACKNL